MDNTIGRDMLIKSGKMSLVSILFVSIIPSIPQKKPCVSVYSETEKPHGFVHDLFF